MKTFEKCIQQQQMYMNMVYGLWKLIRASETHNIHPYLFCISYLFVIRISRSHIVISFHHFEENICYKLT